jgi:hypothetical protein
MFQALTKEAHNNNQIKDFKGTSKGIKVRSKKKAIETRSIPLYMLTPKIFLAVITGFVLVQSLPQDPNLV